MSTTERLAYYRDYNAKRKDSLREYNKKYRLEHLEEERARKKTWRQINPERAQDAARAYRLRTRAKVLWSSAKRRAALAGLPFDLTPEWIDEKIKTGTCEASGLPFHFEFGEYRQHPYAPTLDRKSPALGYTPDNVQVVTWIYNCCKGDWTHEHVVDFAKSILENSADNPAS